ncbi:uncharacterized protein LOC131424244 isoform X2 [Marmota monax]|uniref:uncharacterized protein LOC131424244 isoform X2 n=1 Tax=Marmota monax TaxID=9995 RepID=UPI0026EFEF5F|nr:uncharacterized protein LOC131424244 isoform X2 [Marmota monax]
MHSFPESHWDKSSSEEKKWLDVTENSPQQSHSEQHPEVSASCISGEFPRRAKKEDMERLSSQKTEKSNLMLFKLEDTRKGNAPFFHMAESHLDISSEAKQKRPDDTGHSQQESDSEQDNEECTCCLFVAFHSITKNKIKGYVKGQKHREETANGKGKRSTNSCGAFPKPTDVRSLSSYNRGKIKLELVEPPDTGKEDIPVSHMESNLYRSSEAEQKRLHDMDDTAHHQQKSDSEKHQKVCAACGSRTFEPSTKTINGHGQGKNHIEYKIHCKGHCQKI